jgi:ABC-2 type transport system permease protein
MTMLLTTEVLKLRTVRAPLLLLAAAELIVIAGVSGLVLSGEDLTDSDTATKALAHVGLASLCSLVLGILAVAGEYRHKTITDTYLSTPRRDRPLLAKLAVYTAAGLALGLIASVTALLAAKIWWAAKGESFDLTDADVWRTVAGGIAWNAAFAAIGVGVGALVRNLAGAIAVALAWIALVEGIVGQLIGSGLTRWLPFAAAQALGRTNVGNDDQLPQWGAAAVLGGYLVLLAVLAASNTLRRDVS